MSWIRLSNSMKISGQSLQPYTPDANNIIASNPAFPYTATQDCAVAITMSVSGGEWC